MCPVPPFWVGRRTTLEMPLNGDRKSTRLNSSHSQISYAVFCLKKKNNEIASVRKRTRQNARHPQNSHVVLSAQQNTYTERDARDRPSPHPPADPRREPQRASRV